MPFGAKNYLQNSCRIFLFLPFHMTNDWEDYFWCSSNYWTLWLMSLSFLIKCFNWYKNFSNLEQKHDSQQTNMAVPTHARTKPHGDGSFLCGSNYWTLHLISWQFFDNYYNVHRYFAIKCLVLVVRWWFQVL